MLSRTSRQTWALGTISAFALSLCGAAPSAAASEEIFGRDPWVTMQTKIALMTSDDVSALDVNVDTIDGMVTLHGKVPNEQAKEKADTIARQIDGARSVRNLIQVVAVETQDEVEADDAAITTQVNGAIQADRTLKDSDISVQSVNHGVVLLGGTASSLAAHLQALNVARRVRGVRRVASEITSDNRLYDTGIWNEGAVKKTAGPAPVMSDAGDEAAEAAAGAEISDTVEKMGDAAAEVVEATENAVKDAWITTATKAMLMADGVVSAMDINVDTYDGVVTLFGTVESMKAKEAAEQNARSVSGVRDVQNEIRIATNGQPEEN